MAFALGTTPAALAADGNSTAQEKSMAQQYEQLVSSTCSASFDRINNSTPRPDDHISVSETLSADLPDGMSPLLDAANDQMLTRDGF